MIHAIATIELAPWTLEAYPDVIRKLIPDFWAEKDCIEYRLAIDSQTDLTNQANVGRDKVVLVDTSESLDVLKAHSLASHTHVYRVAVEDYVRWAPMLVIDPVE